MAHHVLQHASHGGVGHGGDLCTRQHALRQQGDGHIHGQYQHDAEHRGAADVDAAAGMLGKHSCSFDAGEHPQRDQHGVAHLIHHAAGGAIRLDVCAIPVGHEDGGIEEPCCQTDEQHQWKDLHDGGHQVHAGGLLDAGGNQGIYQPGHGGSTDEGNERVALAEDDCVRCVDESAGGLEGHHQVADDAHGRAQPVAPGGQEAHQVTKTVVGIGVDAAVQVRPQARQCRE